MSVWWLFLYFTQRPQRSQSFFILYHAGAGVVASYATTGERRGKMNGKVNPRSTPEGAEPKVDGKSSQNGKLAEDDYEDEYDGDSGDHPPPPSLRSSSHLSQGDSQIQLSNAITLPSVALRECDHQRVQNDIESFF